MSTSHPRFDTTVNAGNVATPHARVDERVRVVAAVRQRQHQSGRRHPVERRGHGEVDAGPAAPRPARGRHTPVFRGARGANLSLVTPMPNPDPPPELAPLASFVQGYALGLNVREYRGHGALTHTGGLLGLRLARAPDTGHRARRLGAHQPGVGRGVQRPRLFGGDHYLKAPPVDWVAQFAAVRARNLARLADTELKSTQARDASRSRRCRWPNTPARIPTPGTATSRSPKPPDGCRSASRRRRRSPARSSTGSTTRSSHGGPIASCAPTHSSRLRSSRTVRSNGRRCRRCRRQPTSASTSRICGWCQSRSGSASVLLIEVEAVQHVRRDRRQHQADGRDEHHAAIDGIGAGEHLGGRCRPVERDPPVPSRPAASRR